MLDGPVGNKRVRAALRSCRRVSAPRPFDCRCSVFRQARWLATARLPVARMLLTRCEARVISWAAESTPARKQQRKRSQEELGLRREMLLRLRDGAIVRAA